MSFCCGQCEGMTGTPRALVCTCRRGDRVDGLVTNLFIDGSRYFTVCSLRTLGETLNGCEHLQ